MKKQTLRTLTVVSTLGLAILLCGWSMSSFGSNQAPSKQSPPNTSVHAASDGPADQGPKVPLSRGNAAAGKDVFRYETFGNEGFWTDAIRLPAGVKAARVTPMQAMKLGLSVDVQKLQPAMISELQKELKADPTGMSSKLLNDPNMTAEIINANAILGMPVKGGKAGVSCALCHSITDGSAFSLPNGGSIGHRIDGITNENINIGKIIATGTNSRAWFPMLQLTLQANKGKTFGRAPQGLTENSTEAEVDAYLSNPKYYPVGMFDDTFDGNGDPIRIQPLFRQDLAAPYGSGGTIAHLENFSNLVYTVLFDPTSLTTPGGRALLHKLAGPAGDEVANSYVKVLSDTGVTGYPFVKAAQDLPAGREDAFVGTRVDNTKLLDLNAYEVSLQAPAGERADAQEAAHGRELFRTRGCTSCHNVDQSRPVPSFIVPMKTIYPSDNPVVLAQRQTPLNPIEHMPGSNFDLKMAVTNASVRGGIRGIAMPMLLGLAHQKFYLHDGTVPTLDDLLNPTRGKQAPHPFYLPESQDRKDMAAFLRSLDTGNGK